MKKQLLLAMLASCAATAAMAQTPQEYPNYGFCGMSPDGSIIISDIYGTVTILDTAADKEYSYSDADGGDSYSTGSGNSVSNTGVVVGQVGGIDACYWQNGKWTDLNNLGRSMSIAFGVSPDGNVIAGAIAPENYQGDFEGLMLTPCVWIADGKGGYGAPEFLPFPARDLTGRVPQYVTAVSVSADGKTIAGQITDFGGSNYQPIVYTQGANGEWSYSLPLDNLYHPEGFEMPEDPGEAPNVQPETFMTQEEIDAYNAAVKAYEEKQESIIFPEVTDFMSDEQFVAYQKALDEFYETWENYPDPYDFMTAEEIAAYEKAEEEYYAEIAANQYPDYKDYMSEDEIAEWQKAKEAEEAWDEKWNDFSMAYNELLEIVPSFVFNNAFITPDGSKIYSTYSKETFDMIEWEFKVEYCPWAINVGENTAVDYKNNNGDGLIISSVAADGTILARSMASFDNPAVNAYVLTGGAEEFVDLYDYILEKDATIAAWMKENMTHEYESYVIDEETWEYDVEIVEALPTGIPFTNADMTVIALTVENFWDYDNGVDVYGYIMKSNFSGVNNVSVSEADFGVKGFYGGELQFVGEVASATVYNLAGAAVYSVEAPSATVATGLAHGVYVVKVENTNGAVKSVKVAL